MRVQNMTVQQWATVSDNPRQRDTEAHARKAAKKHLKTFSPAHLTVHAAELPNKKLIKLDGHTRGLLWSTGQLKLQNGSKITVCVHPVKSIDEAKQLYNHFDDPGQTETPQDRATGASRESGVTLTTPWMMAGRFTTALQIASEEGSKMDVYTTTAKWAAQLGMIDKLSIPAFKSSSGVVAAMLVSIKRDGDEALDFWKRFAGDDGMKVGLERDGVQMLIEAYATSKAEGKFARHNHVELCEKALAAYERQRKNKPYVSYTRSSGYTQIPMLTRLSIAKFQAVKKDK
jgi:hypothetical protein